MRNRNGPSKSEKTTLCSDSTAASRAQSGIAKNSLGAGTWKKITLTMFVFTVIAILGACAGHGHHMIL